MQGIHERYQAVLDILVNNQCSVTEAMRQFSIPRNTLRDYIGICKLQIIDGKRYKRVVEAERQKMGKISAKSIELRCRAVLNEYRVQANTLKQQKKLLPFYPRRTFTPQSKCKCPYPSHKGFSDYTPSHHWKFQFFFSYFSLKTLTLDIPHSLGISCPSFMDIELPDSRVGLLLIVRLHWL